MRGDKAAEQKMSEEKNPWRPSAADGAEWLEVPGAEGYEVSLEPKPRVRNRRTRHVLAANWQNQVWMTLAGGGMLHRSGDRCLWAALHGAEVTALPSDIIIRHIGDGRFDIADRKERKSCAPSDESLPPDEKLRQLDECVEFCLLQKQFLRDGNAGALYPFLSQFRERVRMLTMRYFHKGGLRLWGDDETFGDAVCNLVCRIKECKYIALHPTLALYGEMRRLYREIGKAEKEKARTVILDEGRKI